jgi:hypothetical protein
MPSLLKRLSLHSLRRNSSKDKDRSLTTSHDDSAESSFSPPPVPPLRPDLINSTSSLSLAASAANSPPLKLASPPGLVNPNVARAVVPKPLPPSPLPSPADASAPRQAVDAPLTQVWGSLDAQETAMKPGKIDTAVSALMANGSASFVSLQYQI